MTIPPDELDPDERISTLAVYEHGLAAADERAIGLDVVLATLGQASLDAAVPAAARPKREAHDDEPELELTLRRLSYREAAAGLTAPITRALADFLA